MKHLIFGLLLLSSSLPSYSSESLYLKLLKAEKNIFLISSSLHQFSLEDGGSANQKRVTKAIKNFNKSISALKSHYYTNSDISINQLIHDLEGFHSSSILMAKESFYTPEMFVSNKFKQTESDIIFKIRAVQSLLPPPKAGDELTVNKLESITAELLSEYLYICEYTLSSRVMVSNRDIQTINDRIKDFDTLLGNLKNSEHYKEWEPSFKKAEKRWKYFSKHLADFDKGAVPFVISRFSYSLSNALADIE